MISSRRLSVFIFLLSFVFLYFPRYLGEVNAQKQSPSQTAFPSPGQLSISVQAAGRGMPWVNFQDGYALPSFYPPSDSPTKAPTAFQPTTLTTADFDEDGVPDLVTGMRSTSGGRLVLYRGNVDSIFPNSPEAQRRKAAGTLIDAPFLPPVQEVALLEAPDFVGGGDFDADGHADLVVLTRGKSELLVISGDGQGGLHPTQRVDLPGLVRTVAVSQLSLATGSASLAIALQGSDGDELLFLSHSQKVGVSDFQRMKLPGTVTACTFGQLTQTSTADLIVAVGNQLVSFQEKNLLTGNEFNADQIQSFPFVTKAIATGRFHQNQPPQVALLTDQGQLMVGAVGSSDFSSRGQWTGATSLVTARVSSTGSDDLVVLDQANQLHIVLDQASESVAKRTISPVAPVTFDTQRTPVAVLPMRLNVDGLNDLVILKAGDPQPAVALTAPVHTFVVNTADAAFNTGDMNPGDGVCRDFNGNCSLGAAIGEANASAGADLITFNIAPGGPQTIRFDSQFGAIFNPTYDFSETATLDATTQPGFAGTPVISFTGAMARLNCAPSSSNVVIRGIALSGNKTHDFVSNRGGNGMEIQSSNNIIEGCSIQTNQTSGVFITGSNNRIGGTTVAARNVISSNGPGSSPGLGSLYPGIHIQGGSNNQIQGNAIGTDLSGTTPLPNFGNGIYISSGQNNSVGGALPGAGNLIAFNYGNGVEIGHLAQTLSTSNTLVSRNSIYSNTLFGINLVKTNNDGLTVNDLGDADTGNNGLQNYPTITSVASSGGSTTIQGTLNSRPNTTYQLEFFANDAVTSFQYEGQEVIGTTSVTTDGAGNAAFSFTAPVTVATSRFVTSTATDPLGNTSEFSFALKVNTAGNSQPPLIAVIYLNPPQSPAPASVNFNGGVFSVDLDGTIVSYAWNFGDNTTGSGSIVAHTYSTAGNYPVTLTVTDNAGNTASTSVVVIVLAPTTPPPPPPDPNVIPAPSNLTATAASRKVTVRWQDNSTNETNFVVERAPKSTGRFAQAASLVANTTSFIQNLVPGTYLYRVRAYNRTTKKYSAYSNTAEVTVK